MFVAGNSLARLNFIAMITEADVISVAGLKRKHGWRELPIYPEHPELIGQVVLPLEKPPPYPNPSSSKSRGPVVRKIRSRGKSGGGRSTGGIANLPPSKSYNSTALELHNRSLPPWNPTTKLDSGKSYRTDRTPKLDSGQNQRTTSAKSRTTIELHMTNAQLTLLSLHFSGCKTLSFRFLSDLKILSPQGLGLKGTVVVERGGAVVVFRPGIVEGGDEEWVGFGDLGVGARRNSGGGKGRGCVGVRTEGIVEGGNEE
ncbi:hypothetical protein Acr_05g0016720 [Actinidia rufa]|uniref:Uncharacterized protein n=1 Tax=Actinidia rufa TaxID=165716 RepID=A0A7J0ENF8_9ERIC|nr:hypothetical protein Acr_05g0016720 [Actinidia rufa]